MGTISLPKAREIAQAILVKVAAGSDPSRSASGER